MSFLPYENYYLTTKLSPSQVAYRIKENIIPRSRDIFRATTNATRPYEGFLYRNHFEVSRLIKYRNSFLPVIHDDFVEVEEGTIIHIKMKMDKVVSVFMLVWMSGVTLAFIAVILSMIDNRKFEPAIFFILMMYGLGYTLVMGGFKYESMQSKKFFNQLLEAETIKQ